MFEIVKDQAWQKGEHEAQQDIDLVIKFTQKQASSLDDKGMTPVLLCIVYNLHYIQVNNNVINKL